MKERFTIATIVEGEGEVACVPVLLRRWFRHRRFHNFCTPDLAIRAAGCGALKTSHDADGELGVEYYVTLALGGEPDAILIILDADDECRLRASHPERPGLGPELLERAKKVAPHVPLAVVVANPEFEAWFLADVRNLRQQGLFLPTALVPAGHDIEKKRGCKSMVAEFLGRKYGETVDQLLLASALSFGTRPRKGARSYGRLLLKLEQLAADARHRRLVRRVRRTEEA